jgi:hypothetical protein
VAGRTHTAEVVVQSDPRVTMSEADRLARHEAVMSLFELTKSVTEARQATRRLSAQASAMKRLLEEHGDAPEALGAAVDSLAEDLDDLNDEIGTASRDTRLQGAIERSDGPPTADQLWQINRAWERIPALIGKLNDLITVRMPAINQRLDAEGIRPDPGSEITAPVRSGRR